MAQGRFVKRLWLWARYDVLGDGLSCLILLFFCAAVGLGLLGYELKEQAKRKTTPVTATITAFELSKSRVRPNFGVVYAQGPDGLIGSQAIQLNQIVGCKVGDRIRAERYGISLTLKPAPCPIIPISGSNAGITASSSQH